MKQQKKRSKSILQHAESFCVVKAFYKEKDLVGVWIELVGAVSQIPSTSNNKTIFNKRHGGKVVPFIAKNPRHIEALDLMTKLYFAACAEQKTPIPTFTDQSVFVLAMLGARKGRWDSHNMSKPIGDWLQSIRIVDDDKQAEIYCVKKSDYPELSDHQNTTQIIIQPKSQVKSLTTQYLYEIGKASTGFQYIG